MNTSPDHPDFTALALGEHIHGNPARGVLDALRTSVAARNEADQIRITAEKLASALRGETPVRLDAARRHAIFSANLSEVRARFVTEEAASRAEEPELPAARAPRRWMHPGLAAAAVVAAALLITRLLPGLNMPTQNDRAPVASPNQGGTMMVTPAQSPKGPGKALTAPPPAIAEQGESAESAGSGTNLPDAQVPPSLAEKSPDLVPNPAPPGKVAPPPAANLPPPKDPANFDYATPIVVPPKKNR